MPVVIGSGGVERIVEISLNKSENTMFKKSVDNVRSLKKLVAKMEADENKQAAAAKKKAPVKKG